MNEILKKIDELIDKTNYELYKAGLEDAKDIILSQHKELAADNNVVTKSGKDNNAKDADYWEREAKKWCAKLGEIRLWMGEHN